MLIPLHGVRGAGKFAIIDDSDYEIISKSRWYSDGEYAIHGGARYTKSVKMHALINNTPNGMQTDHINGDTFDNRRCNLRSCTGSENAKNRCRQSNNTSGAKGVCLQRGNGLRRDRWKVRVMVNGKRKLVGHFQSVSEAGAAYERAAAAAFGAFRRDPAYQ